MDYESTNDSKKTEQSVSRTELNSWRRGFTPQAEIWNGRMAIVGLLLFLFTLIGSNLLFGS